MNRTTKHYREGSPAAYGLARGEPRMKRPPRNHCEWIYGAVTVTVSGDMVPCRRDSHGRLVVGNVFRESIGDVRNGPRFRAVRRGVARDRAHPSLRGLREGTACLRTGKRAERDHGA